MKTLMVRLAKKSGPLEEDGGDEELCWHTAIAKSIKFLDQIAKGCSVATLSSFVSEDPENVYDAVDDEGEAERVLAKLPPVKWYDPRDAVATVEAMINEVSSGKTIDGIKNPAKVLGELQDLKAILLFAIKKKANFRFYEQF